MGMKISFLIISSIVYHSEPNKILKTILGGINLLYSTQKSKLHTAQIIDYRAIILEPQTTLQACPNI